MLQPAAQHGSLRVTRTNRHSVCRQNVGAKATAVAGEAIIDRLETVMQPLGGYFPPILTNEPERLMEENSQPFLTKQAGSLPVKPHNLYNALYTYGNYSSKYVSVRVQNVHVKLQSWEHAVDTLADAHEAKKPYWCSLIENVQHPGWWPTEGHVPQYDQVIFGRGNASIGLHFDKDNACAGGSMQPVSTYLAICEGAKLTLLLPPDQTLLPPGGDPDLLLNPTPQFIQDVKAAGGYFFLLQDVTNNSNSSRDTSTFSVSSSKTSDSLDNAGEFSATALYMPAGWYHWLVGLTDWHIVYGGSFYPEQQRWLNRQN